MTAKPSLMNFGAMLSGQQTVHAAPYVPLNVNIGPGSGPSQLAGVTPLLTSADVPSGFVGTAPEPPVNPTVGSIAVTPSALSRGSRGGSSAMPAAETLASTTPAGSSGPLAASSASTSPALQAQTTGAAAKAAT